MAKRNEESPLRGTRELTRHAELDLYAVQFAAGHYRRPWIYGRPGVGKTETVKAAMAGRPQLYIKSGAVKPLALYKDCFEHIDEPVILDLDNVEALLKTDDGSALLLGLGETTLEKTLHWHSTTPRLGKVPTSFATRSPLCVVANHPPRDAALRSRARPLLFFNPTDEEVHRYVASWFHDQPIHDFVGRHLQNLGPIDCRMYLEACDDLQAGRDWANILLRGYALNLAEALVQSLEHDANYQTTKAKEQRFRHLMAGKGGGSRTTYNELRKKLADAGKLEPATIGSIRVKGKPPPRVDPVVAADSAQPPADLPAHDGFTTPITGATPGRQRPNPGASDDTTGRPLAASDRIQVPRALSGIRQIAGYATN